jgi:hypothetical protein
MKQASLIFGFSAVIAASLLISSPSSAKTVKACEDEWKSNKSTIQASGKKKKDFIVQCRAETASTEPATAPGAQPAQAETPNSSVPTPRTRSAKTLRACGAEWIANKETLQASGKTRKDFITDCRAGAETAATTAAPSAEMTPSTATAAGNKTAKACEADWKANKASIQASGKKKTDFMTECRAEPASAQTAATPAPQPAPAERPKSEVAAAPQSTTAAQPKSEATAAPRSTNAAQPKSEATVAPAPLSPTGSLATGQFTTEAQAKTHCPGDTIVWANTRSKVYHYASSRRYGRTKIGAYMCEKETAAAGIRAPKRERRL